MRWTGDTKTVKKVHETFDLVSELEPFLYFSNVQFLTFIGSPRSGYRRLECKPTDVLYCFLNKKIY